MMYSTPSKALAATALSLLTLSRSAIAVTNFTDSQMQTYLSTGMAPLAQRYAPLWFYSAMDNNLPCIPTWAFSGSPSAPDTYSASSLTPPAKQCNYPNVGCSCRNPGVPKNSALPEFPIYYVSQQCNATEVRIAYNLFYQKDGAEFIGIQTGHNYDWERVVVVHSKDATDGTWQPSEAILSYHSGDKHIHWADIQNSLSDEDYNAGKSTDPNGLQDLDHPKVYVGWSKHPHFDTRNTGWKDPASQSLDNAYRGQDWWHAPLLKNYIQCDLATDCGKAMNATNWGSATSDPTYVQQQLCSV